jgi:hypothetical protein
MNYAMRALPLLALAAAPVLVRALVQAPAPGSEQAPQAAPDASAPTAKAIQPDADRMLRQMTDYLSGLQNFKVESFSVDEVVTTTGRKIQIAADSIVSVSRPNKLRSDRVGAENGLEYWYDGKTMSLYCKANNTYSTVPAPATIDEAIDATRKQYKIEAPGADLLFSHPYDILTEQVKTGLFVGKESIGSVAANHLAFEGEDVDWQIWIQDGAQPLPLRFVITTKTMKEQPQFTVQLSNWDTNAKFDDSTFRFQPPAGAKAVDSFPTECRAQH